VLSYRNAPKSRGISRAMPESVPRLPTSRIPLLPMGIQLFFTNPTDVRTVAVGRNGAVPRGIIIGLVQTQVLGRIGRGLRALDDDGLKRRLQELGVMNVGTSYHNRKGAPCTRRAGSVSRRAWRGLSGWPLAGFLQPRFSHRGVRRLPCPVHSAQPGALALNQCPNLLENPHALPALESSVHRSEVGKLLGQMIPLNSGAHAIDEGIEGRTRIDPLAPKPLGRVVLFENRRDSLSHSIGKVPDRRQGFFRAITTGWHWDLLANHLLKRYTRYFLFVK